MNKKQIQCPKCGSIAYTKNGSSCRGNNMRPKYKCKKCGKEFVQKLTRTEKRLFSLFENLIKTEAPENCTVKEFIINCNKENVKVNDFYLDILTKDELDKIDLDNTEIIITKTETGYQILKLRNAILRYHASQLKYLFDIEQVFAQKMNIIQPKLLNLFSKNRNEFDKIVNNIERLNKDL